MNTYSELVANFKPAFGNANHISAVPLIAKVAKMQERLNGYNERTKHSEKQPKPPRALIKELTSMEQRVISLIAPGAKRVPYKGPAESDDV